jgi:hypothetical protein
MSLTKLKEKQKELHDNFDERVAAVEAQLEPNFGKYRPIAEIYMEHGHFPPVPKEKQNDEQYKKDEYAIRLSYCHARGIPEDFANELQLIQGALGIGIDTAMSLFKTAHPFAQFDVLEANDREHKMNVRINPSKPWTYFVFTIIEAQELGYLKKNNKNWEGINGRQNMIAKNNYSFAIKALDRGCLHGMTIIDTGFYDMQQIPAIPTTDKIIEGLTQNPEVIQSSFVIEPAAESAIEPVEEVVEAVVEVLDPKVGDPKDPAQIEKEIVTEIVDPKELRDELTHVEASDHELESTFNTTPISPEEIQQIREDKIKELPPSPDAAPEQVEEVAEAEPEYIYGEWKGSDVCMICNKHKNNVSIHNGTCFECDNPNGFDEQAYLKMMAELKKSREPIKPDTSFLNKKPELVKPWEFNELTVNDQTLHTAENYARLGEDWFCSLKVDEANDEMIRDQNIIAYGLVIDQVCPQLRDQIFQTFELLKAEPLNHSDRLTVLFHDAMVQCDPKPDIPFIDTIYFQKMAKLCFGIEVVAQDMKNHHITESGAQFDHMKKASKNLWDAKDCAFALRYMHARNLL